MRTQKRHNKVLRILRLVGNGLWLYVLRVNLTLKVLRRFFGRKLYAFARPIAAVGSKDRLGVVVRWRSQSVSHLLHGSAQYIHSPCVWCIQVYSSINSKSEETMLCAVNVFSSSSCMGAVRA